MHSYNIEYVTFTLHVCTQFDLQRGHQFLPTALTSSTHCTPASKNINLVNYFMKHISETNVNALDT